MLLIGKIKYPGENTVAHEMPGAFNLLSVLSLIEHFELSFILSWVTKDAVF